MVVVGGPRDHVDMGVDVERHRLNSFYVNRLYI
jgi:hypothetical protein